MTIHQGAKRYVDAVLAAPPIWEVPLEEVRRAVDAETLDVWGPVDEVEHVEDVVEGGIRMRVYRPDADELLATVVYLHGGGWAVGSIESHDPLCRAIAARTPAEV